MASLGAIAGGALLVVLAAGEASKRWEGGGGGGGQRPALLGKAMTATARLRFGNGGARDCERR